MRMEAASNEGNAGTLILVSRENTDNYLTMEAMRAML